MYYFLGYLIYLVPLLLIGCVVGVIFAVRRRKVFSPEESEETFLLLQKEVKKWQEEGIIEEEQAKRIIGRYLSFREERKAIRAEARLVKIFSIFGTILVGIGVILLIATNWGKLPPFFNTSLLILATLATYYIGWQLKYERKTHLKVGDALIFLGSLLFGASLILICQIYHIRIEYSNLILVWALAILPLAYFTKSSPILALGSILTFAWGIFSFYTERELFFREIQIPIQYYLSFLFILGAIVPLTYKLKSIKVQALNMAEILAWLGIIATLDWFKESENIFVSFCLFFLMMGGLLFFLGEIHSKWKERRYFKEIYYYFGLILVFLTSFILSFPQVYLVYAKEVPFEAVFFNFILFGEICGAIYLGIRRREEYFVNLATLFFGLLVFARYFSLTWTLEDRAFVFIFGGILLIVGSYFIDKMRRKLLEKIPQ